MDEGKDSQTNQFGNIQLIKNGKPNGWTKGKIVKRISLVTYMVWLNNSSKVIHADYIRESYLEPDKHIVTDIRIQTETTAKDMSIETDNDDKPEDAINPPTIESEIRHPSVKDSTPTFKSPSTSSTQSSPQPIPNENIQTRSGRIVKKPRSLQKQVSVMSMNLSAKLDELQRGDRHLETTVALCEIRSQLQELTKSVESCQSEVSEVKRDMVAIKHELDTVQQVKEEIEELRDSSAIPKDVLSRITSEEELETILDFNAAIENEQNSIAMELDDNIHNDVELDPQLPDNLTNNRKTVSQKGGCIVCKEGGSNIKNCAEYERTVHYICGGCRDGSNLLCLLCLQEKRIIEERKSSYVGQKRVAEKMFESSAQKFKPIEVGTCVKVASPKVDRGPLDKQNLLGQVMELENEVYRIRTKSGIIKNWFSRNEIDPCKSGPSFLHAPDNMVTLQEAITLESKFGGQGYKNCFCRASKFQCNTNNCCVTSCFTTRCKTTCAILGAMY
ncbi:hypothetical protein QE152_g30728 [Popillia japonica]|uniref:Uncharacterized protein n=1 Tax=Popillia japonica TaxID=7064 RepID=A0AAW1JDP2_POPJA